MAKKPLVPFPKKTVMKPPVPLPNLAKQVVDARRLAQAVKKLTPKVPPKALRYIIQLSDDTAVYAEGALADLLYRYAKECEAQAQMNRLVVYNGPEVGLISLNELREHLKVL